MYSGYILFAYLFTFFSLAVLIGVSLRQWQIMRRAVARLERTG